MDLKDNKLSEIKSDREILYDLTCMWNLQVNLKIYSHKHAFTHAQTHRTQRERYQIHGYQRQGLGLRELDETVTRYKLSVIG